MPYTVNANQLETQEGPAENNINVSVDVRPNECPICHVTIEPQYLNGTPLTLAFDWLEVCYRCSNLRCRRHFTALYRRVGMRGSLRAYELDRCLPTEPRAQAFDSTVGTLSPNFVSIYGQASAAEDHALMDIAGPGYRKALEFLIKDYAIQLNPNNEAQIKQKPLAQVIKEYLPGDKLSIVSSRAVWLGNDETHYERRWIGKDLQDLKKLISATVHFIAMEKLAAELPVDMPAPGPPTPPQA